MSPRARRTLGLFDVSYATRCSRDEIEIWYKQYFDSPPGDPAVEAASALAPTIARRIDSILPAQAAVAMQRRQLATHRRHGLLREPGCPND